MIGYVCAPALAGGGASVASSVKAADPSHFKPSADAGPENALKRFGLQILRAVIETAPPAGDGAEGLPGVWQAGGGAGSSVSANEGRRGRSVDEEAIRLDRVSPKPNKYVYIYI